MKIRQFNSIKAANRVLLDVVNVTLLRVFQGDVEKSLGWKPIPLFDRDNYSEVASMQVTGHSRIIFISVAKGTLSSMRNRLTELMLCGGGRCFPLLRKVKL